MARAQADASDTGSQTAGVRRALILAGLPGDEAHDQRFRSILTTWHHWLTQVLKFPSENVTVLYGRKPPRNTPVQPATRENLQRIAAELQEQIGPQDTLWVLVLGHANYDGQRGWLHLPGPDINDMQWADLFAPMKCREQVFWMTHTCSGWFLRPLSRKGRIVITATEADNEFNETEFPDALAGICQRGAEAVDEDGDGRVSLAELFVTVVEDVNARYAADDRAPTEHAQMDDDGDGHGTEADKLPEPKTETPPDASIPLSLRRDGGVASRLYLPWQMGDVSK